MLKRFDNLSNYFVFKFTNICVEYSIFFMNILLEAYKYLDYIFQKSTGFKALLCDRETLKFVSVAMTSTELCKYEVFVVDELASFVRRPKDPEVETFSCFCLLRATSENINLVCSELEKQHFPRYNLYFTSSISDEQIRQLGSCDSQSLIQDLQEIYIDFSALGTRLFSLNTPDISDFRNNPSLSSYSDRIVEGLFASICALQVKPTIRYDCNSLVTKAVASKLSELVQTNSDLFKGHYIDNTLVLILDRRNDPVTPLLHIFYYYPIIHDLFTIDNNVVLIGKNKLPIDERNDPETEKVGTMYLEDAGMAISNNLQNITKIAKDLEDTKITTMNEKMVKCLQGSTQKVYAENNRLLFKALHKKVKDDDLTIITALEQIIVSSTNADYQYLQLEKLVTNPKCSPENALRLCLIFILHYEKSNNDLVMRAMNLLQSKCQWSGNEMRYPNTLITISGYDKRTDKIFPTKSIITMLKNSFGIDDQSQFDRYHPPLETILQNIKDKKLDTDKYPFINKQLQAQKVIIFYVGGATYMEHAIATQMSDKSFQFIVGGTTIHNAESFLRYEVAPFC